MRSFIVLIEVAILLGGVGGFQSWLSKVALRPRTQLSGRKTSGDSLIVGINKYSHDASICILDGKSGEILFAQAKERISAKKHDGGGVGKLLKLALKSVGGRLKDVELIVQNNHHFRVNPFEKRLPFASSINYVPSSYLDDYNLVPKAKCLEISHHLAHAWSGLSTAPFSEGLVVVMDGMGESYKAMIEDMRGIESFSGDYLHDLKLLKLYGTDNFIGQPVSLFPGSTYREAETAYLWNSQKSSIQPVFKRWSREQSPSELYNHGFENMESIGAVYSRLSSHILGDWNACGKIMGLSSWSNHKSKDAKDWYYPSKNKDEKESLSIGKEFHHRLEFMKGNPVKGTFTINWELLDSLQHINQFSPSKFDYFANLAASIQDNLNDVTIQMLQSLKEQTKAKNLVFVGGVALNSILNQKILESNLFEQVYVPSYPGDEGIAIGCAMYGFQRKREEELLKIDEEKATVKSQQILPVSTAANIQNEVKDHQCKSTEPCNDPQNCASKANQDQNVHCQSQDHDHDHDHGHDHSQEPDVVPFHQQNFSPFSGFQISSDMIESAIEDYQSYVVVDKFASSEQLIEDASQALAEGKVIAWFQGRSEFGQRALGHRSILGNPSIPSLRRFINEKIKFREWYRPLAPSVLSEHVSEWFELPTSLTGATKLNFSPFMSYTAKIKAEKVNQIPSVCHIDQTARLQTVTRDPDNQLYYDLIEKFYQKTKIPMILNTSLNKKSQPIIETPLQAIQFLLSLQNNLNSLYINNYKISLKPFPFPEKKGEEEDEPSVQDRNIYVKGKLLYRSELTFIGNEAKAQRARIQDNLLLLDPFEHYDVSASTSDDEDNEKAMRELPSDLHLELLQLLQEIPNMDDGSDDGHDHDHSHEHGEDLGENDTNSSIEESESMSRESGITLDELWHYLIQLRQSSSSQEEDDDKNNSENVVITWSSVKEALKWLYYEGLVEFPSSNGNLNDKAGKEVDKKVSTTKIEVESNDEQREEKIDEAEDDALISDVSGLFPGVNIRDLRTLG